MSKKKNKKPNQKNKSAGKSKKRGASKPPKPAFNQKYNSILNEAQTALDEGRDEDAIDLVEAMMIREVRESDLMAFIFASRIKGFALANLKRHDDVVLVALEVLAIDRDLLDFYYLLSYSYLAMEEYNLAEVYALKFVDLCASHAEDWTSPYMMSETAPNLFMVHNFLAVALKGQGRFQEACVEFERSYKLNPKYAPAYINHAQLLHGLRDDAAARAVLDLAVQAGVNAQEVGMMARTVSSGPQVSVCMIVKNEEKLLDKCLNSIEDFADEIIIVDTGSSDNTVEIAKRHGAKVYFHEWENDFSKARNFSLSYAKTEWIFIMDADEELVVEDIPVLKEIMRQKDYNMISINVYNLGPEGSSISSFLPSIRMFRRTTGAKYEGIVHNQLKFDEEREKVLRVNARIKHYGYGLDAESMKRKVARSKKLLLKQVAENPDNFFAHFNLAQLYRGESPNPSPEVCHKIIEHAGFVIEHTDPYKRGQRHLHLMSLHQMVSANFFLEEYDQAIEYCLKALEYKPNFLDAIISLGHIFSQKKDLANARVWYMKYLEELDKYDESQETDQIILLNLKSSHLAFCGLGYISEAEKKIGEAIAWYQKCLAASPDYLDLHLRLGTILFNQKRYPEALRELELETRLHKENWAAYYTQGETYIRMKDPLRAEEAYLLAYRYKQNNPHVLYSLARLYVDTNRPQEALKYVQILQGVDHEFVEAYRIMGDIQFQFGQYREASAAYTNYVIRNAGDIEVWNNLGNAHFKLGEFEQACKCYQKVIESDSSYGLAYRNLAVCLGRMGDYENAHTVLKDYLCLAPDDIDLLILAAEICTNLKNYEEAISYLEKAIGLNPNSPQLLTILADCYAECGYLDSARMGYHQALKIDQDYKPAREKLARMDEILASQKR
jgi:tetratricopeptide (TPR) repeat protein